MTLTDADLERLWQQVKVFRPAIVGAGPWVGVDGLTLRALVKEVRESRKAKREISGVSHE